MPLRSASVLALVLVASACSFGDPVDAATDSFSSDLLSLSRVDGFGGLELVGDAVTLYTIGERPGTRVAAQSILGAAVPLAVVAVEARGRGSEGLKNRVSSIVTVYISADYDETTGYVRVGVQDADALRLAQEELRGVAAADRQYVLLRIERPVARL